MTTTSRRTPDSRPRLPPRAGNADDADQLPAKPTWFLRIRAIRERSWETSLANKRSDVVGQVSACIPESLICVSQVLNV